MIGDSGKEPGEDGPDAGARARSERDPVILSAHGPNPFVLLGIGSLNAVCWLTGFLLGWLADDQLNTAPVFVVLGLVAGVGLGAVASYQQVRRYLRP